MTSIEWLIDKLGISEITHKKLFEQAKEMHKEEIKMAYHNGYSNAIQEKPKQYNPGQYYQETFGSKGSDDTPMERKLLKSGFVDVVPKQETLYTKQDIIDSVNRMYDIFMDDTLEAKKLRLKGISWHIQNTLQSLKQPKK